MNNLPAGCRAIQLTKGKIAIIDDADYAIVSGYKWQASNQWHRIWYAVRDPSAAEKRSGSPQRISMHRQILGLPNELVDHRDGNGLNNRRSNLRLSTLSQNMANRHTVQGQVRFRGVNKVGQRYMARVWKDKRARCMGTFTTPEEAARAYDRGAIEVHGEFAVTNALLGLLSE